MGRERRISARHIRTSATSIPLFPSCLMVFPVNRLNLVFHFIPILCLLALSLSLTLCSAIHALLRYARSRNPAGNQIHTGTQFGLQVSGKKERIGRREEGG